MIVKNGVQLLINAFSRKARAPNNCARLLATKTRTKLGYKYETLKDIANFLQSKVCIKPHVGIICGSGLGSLADNIVDPQAFPYEDIPNFPTSTVPGHSGRLVFGKICDVPVVIMKGRFHFYEGYPLWKACLLPVRVMKLIGVKSLIVTNAAGGLNPNFKLGDLMIIKDHINVMGFAGQNPLNGPNDDKFGPRFPAVNKAYTLEYRKAAKEIAKEQGISKLVHEGVYACLGGPNFETVAELIMLKMCGADSVGMSTAHEVITAAHCGMNVFAMSLITNECILTYDTDAKANHQEVLDAAKSREEILKNFVSRLVATIKEIDDKNCKKK